MEAMTRKEKHIKARHEVLEQLDEVLSLRKAREGISHSSPTKDKKNSHEPVGASL
jgi:hypothetical protein